MRKWGRFLNLHANLRTDPIFALYNKDLMTGRGNRKYGYKEGVRIEVEKYLREEMKKYFPSNRIAYIV